MERPGDVGSAPAHAGAARQERQDTLVYRLERSLYVNVTNACTASCAFCPREERPEIGDSDLTLTVSHPPEEFVAAVDAAVDARRPDEVVFCGFGEPTLRMDVLLAVARRAREHGIPVRLNTNGHGDLTAQRPVLHALRGLVAAISVSLNAPDAKTYERIVRPHCQGAWEAVQAFIRDAVALGFDVTATAVDCLDAAQIADTERLAGALGARFRLRPLW